MTLNQKIINYIRAGYTTFYLHTAETDRAEMLVADIAQQLQFKVHEFNLAQGKIDFQNKSLIKDNQGRIENSFSDLIDEDMEQCLFLIKNAKLALENNPIAIARLQYLIEKIERFSGKECAIILQSAEIYIPADLEPFITLIEMPLPQEADIRQIIQTQQTDISPELLSSFTTALSGLNELEIKKVLTLIAQQISFSEENHDAILQEIRQQKEQIIAKSGVLEMVKVDNNINDIGGLEQLKQWLTEQHYTLSHLEEAKSFGVKAPKGTLIAGMPGCGKSLTAKAAAALFRQPLLRLDIGSLLGKYVGESENNMRKALAMAESISPCVLWVDELEKAFVGMKGDNASEVSSRLLGYFLTWLQEKSKPVFIIATANDITALPPELLRKGRFDEIFYVGFPNFKEREQIIKIHLSKAKQKAEQFDLHTLARLCRDYSGADIENAIYDGVKKAFISNNKMLTQTLLEEAIKKTVPLRKTLKDKVGEYEKKFDELYLSPASHNDGLSISDMIKMADNPNYLERKKVAEYEEVTEELLEKLSQDTNLEVRKAVFSNPSCPTKILDKQISLETNDKLYNKDIFEIITKHRNVSLELALEKCRNTENYVDNVMKNRVFGVEHISLLEKLAKDSSYYVRKYIPKNSYITEEIQKILAKDSNNDIKKTLASNVNITQEVQEILAKDDDYDVRTALASNINITKNVKKILDSRNIWFFSKVYK